MKCFYKTINRKNRKDLSNNAYDVIADFERGQNLYGFTLGRFSLVDLIIAVQKKIGNCHIIISTWAAAKFDISKIGNSLLNKEFLSAKWLLDPAFKSRPNSAIFYKEIIERYGSEHIRIIPSHAKFIVMYNDDWNVVIRTSMNLTGNPRIENFEISDDKDFRIFFTDFVEKIFEEFPEDDFDFKRGYDKIENTFKVEKTEKKGLVDHDFKFNI